MKRRLSVLVVEDDDALRNLYKELLGSDGHDVRAASDGSEALRMLDGQLDLVVTDLNMPNMSGQQFLEALRNTGRLPALPVLVVTAFPEELPASVSGPRVTVLRKPFQIDAFSDFVSAIADGMPAQPRDSD